MDISEIYEKLKISEFDNNWKCFIQGTNALTGDGINSGLMILEKAIEGSKK